MKQYLPPIEQLREELAAKIIREKLTLKLVARESQVNYASLKAFMDGKGDASKYYFSTLLRITNYLGLVPVGDKVIKDPHSTPIDNPMKSFFDGEMSISEKLWDDLGVIAERKDVHINLIVHLALQEYVDKRKKEDGNK